MYIDSSIRFNTNEINSIIEASQETALLTRYISLYLTCFTHPLMFEWFGETPNMFRNIFTTEANFILINNNFLTSLIMKAWVYCALDKSCIAPLNSHIYGDVFNLVLGCKRKCGCHRFDQDALTIVLSYFYLYPRDFNRKPAFSLSDVELDVFNINRRTPYEYILDQIESIFL
jgi:hypothetical protein